MWLPTPIYERKPQFYALVGLLFITDGLYLGFNRLYAFGYVGLGIGCFLYGTALFILRRRYRQVRPTSDNSDEVTDESETAAAPPGEQPVA